MRTILRLLLAYVLVALSFVGCSEEPRPGMATLSGHVTAADGLSLSGVDVSLSPLNRKTATGKTGEYTFGRIAAGEYIVSFSKDGFDEAEKPITVEPGIDVRLDAVLQAKGGSVEIEQSVKVIAGMLDCGRDALSVELNVDVEVEGTGDLTWSFDISPAPWLKAATPLGGIVKPGHNRLKCIFDVDRSVVKSPMTAVLALSIGSNTYPIVTSCQP